MSEGAGAEFEEPLEIEFGADADYFAAWRRALETRARRGPERATDAWVLYGGTAAAGIGGVSLMIAAGYVAPDEGEWVAVGAASLFYLGLHVGWWLAARVARRDAEAVDRELLPNEPVTARLDEDGVTYRQDGGSFFWPWRYFSAAEQDAEGLVLTRGGMPVLLLQQTLFKSPELYRTWVDVTVKRIARARRYAGLKQAPARNPPRRPEADRFTE